MRNWMSLSLVALIALSAAGRAEEAPAAAAEAPAAPAQPAAPAAARITCENPVFDFGQADSSVTVEHEFVLKNTGDVTLEIGQVRPSCGCTVANVTERSVPPGGETRVMARLSLAGRVGLQQKSIVVDSNDPQQPQYILTLKGEVAVAVSVQPDRVVFGQLSPDGGQGADIQISGSGSPAFRVTNVETSSSNLVAKVDMVEEGKSYKLNLQIVGPLTEGALNGYVRISTDHPARPTIDVPVTAVVVGALLVAPQEIMLAAQTEGDPQTQTRYVIIRSSKDVPFKIEGVDTPDASITTQVFPFGAAGYRIQIDNLKPEASLNGANLVIRTDVEGMKEISVPIRIASP